jgi:flagellin-specific chaperone FliS
MTHDQEQLIIELIENDIKQHSTKGAHHPMYQSWADGRVEDLKEALEAFRELKDDLDFANGKGCNFTG